MPRLWRSDGTPGTTEYLLEQRSGRWVAAVVQLQGPISGFSSLIGWKRVGKWIAFRPEEMARPEGQTSNSVLEYFRNGVAT